MITHGVISSSNEGQQQQGNKGCCRSSKRSSQAAACLRWNGHWWFGKKKTWSRRMVDNPTTKGPLLRFGPMHLCHHCHGNNYPILQWNCFEKLFHLAVLNVEWLLPRNWNLVGCIFFLSGKPLRFREDLIIASQGFSGRQQIWKRCWKNMNKLFFSWFNYCRSRPLKTEMEPENHHFP